MSDGQQATQRCRCASCGSPMRTPPKSPITTCLPCRRQERARTDGGKAESGDDTARVVLEDVAALVSSDRDTHGDAVENQEHIARGWTWYLRGQGVLEADESLSGGDVGRMMAILKMSRTAVGSYDVDHDRDIAGYAGIAAACEYSRGNVPDDELTVSDYGAHE